MTTADLTLPWSRRVDPSMFIPGRDSWRKIDVEALPLPAHGVSGGSGGDERADESEGADGQILERDAAMQELVDQAQANDMGYGA